MRAMPSLSNDNRNLLRFVALRLLGVALILFLISFFTFSLMYLAPGDLVKNLIGNRPATPETIAQIRALYHLDEPFINQYLLWLSNALRGDFGVSIRLNEPVAQVIGARFGLTALLSMLAFAFAVVISLSLGVASALKANSKLDKAITLFGLIGLSAPSFVVGLAVLMIFAYYIPIFPVYGIGSGFADLIYHLVLPSFTLSIGLVAYLMRITRAAMIRELASDYITFAKSRGLSRNRIIRIALRNASIPIATSAGLLLTYLVGGTILVETIFSLPGIGLLMEEAVLFKDIPVVQGLTLLVAFVIGVVTLLVDVSYRYLDPRQRAS